MFWRPRATRAFNIFEQKQTKKRTTKNKTPCGAAITQSTSSHPVRNLYVGWPLHKNSSYVDAIL